MPSSVRYSLTGFAAILLAMPILVIGFSWFVPSAGGFDYLLAQGLIAEYARNSLLITVLTGIGACVIGVFCSWAVSMWEFPARRAISWLLVMPFAVPAYVAAMVYGYLLEGAGPVQTLLRDVTGLRYHEYSFPPIRSLGGVVFILSLTLYPYVYLLMRAAFTAQPRAMLEAAEVLGAARQRRFWALSLPLARPALAAGAALVMMEALADYGVVSLYGVPAFTTGIFRVWQGFYDPVAAARLACMLLLVVLGLLWVERFSRSHARYDNATGHHAPVPRRKIRYGWLVTLLCLLPVCLGFLLPLGFVVSLSASHLPLFFDDATLHALANSLKVALITALLASIMGLGFAYAQRGCLPVLVLALIRLATSGYAIPGAVIAVGMLFFLLHLQEHVFAQNILLTGTLLGVVWGCTLRFLTIGFAQAESGLLRITPAMDAAAASLGATRMRTLMRVHFPLMKASMIASFILVFVDTVKELPATLLLRPFNFSTLAIRTHELAQDDLLAHACPTALLLMLISALPVWYFNTHQARQQSGGVDV